MSKRDRARQRLLQLFGDGEYQKFLNWTGVNDLIHLQQSFPLISSTKLKQARKWRATALGYKLDTWFLAKGGRQKAKACNRKLTEN